MIVWWLDLQLHVQSVHITTKVVSSNPVHGEVYSIQYHVTKFVSDLRQGCVFLLFNQEKFYNNILADLETSYHLLTSIYYKNSLNLRVSIVTKYYP